MTSTNNYLSRAEIFALDQTLAEYPDNLTYDEVQDLLIDNEEGVYVWQPLEDMPISKLIEFQNDLKWGVERLLNESPQKAIF
jgi:hypothetical protein